MQSVAEKSSFSHSNLQTCRQMDIFKFYTFTQDFFCVFHFIHYEIRIKPTIILNLSKKKNKKWFPSKSRMSMISIRYYFYKNDVSKCFWANYFIFFIWSKTFHFAFLEKSFFSISLSFQLHYARFVLGAFSQKWFIGMKVVFTAAWNEPIRKKKFRKCQACGITFTAIEYMSNKYENS